jgi:hypothetical protein
VALEHSGDAAFLDLMKAISGGKVA